LFLPFNNENNSNSSSSAEIELHYRFFLSIFFSHKPSAHHTYDDNDHRGDVQQRKLIKKLSLAAADVAANRALTR
jgi:hypothetical protein